MGDLHPIYVLTLVVAALPVLWAALTDLRRFEIPNECSIMLIALYPLYLAVSPAPVDVVGAIVTASAVFALTFGIYLFGRFGGGDVKLMTTLALWAGPAYIAEFIVITTVAGALLSFVYLTKAKFAVALALDDSGEADARDNVLSAALPYGVAIACGGIAVFLKLVM